MTSYTKKRNALVKKFKEALTKNNSIGLGKTTSNLFRQRKVEGQRIDVTNFNQVIKIDTNKGICEVEGMMAYEDLVEETLKKGFIPTVVPQLKTITIGGALTGLGIESSSFKFGLVHETIEEIEILTPEMKIIVCNKKKNRDLFYGFPNSYGTLGYALKIKVKIIPAKKYVKLKRIKFTNSKEYFSEIERYSKLNYDFIDGVIFNENEMYLTLGEMIDTAPYISDYTYMDIYFKSIKRKKEDYLTIKDSLWRWDTDWFWCSKHFFVQNFFVRFLVGKRFLKSKTYWKISKIHYKIRLNKSVEKILGRRGESVVQDVEIPVKSAYLFASFFHKKIGIKPIWVCPTKIYNPKTKFPLYIMDAKKLYINFGFWDIVKSNKPEGYYNKLIESKVNQLEGRKSLYSSSYYEKDSFWKLYNKKEYDKLKKKYDPNKKFKNLYDKCVLRE